MAYNLKNSASSEGNTDEMTWNVEKENVHLNILLRSDISPTGFTFLCFLAESMSYNR